MCRRSATIATTLVFAVLAHSTCDAWAFVDTEQWLGAEYTPAAAPGNGYVRALSLSDGAPRPLLWSRRALYIARL